MADFALLLGATASGKTSLCEQLVDLPIEIINADMLQMYKLLRIGNARPTAELLTRLPHHLLAFLEPELEFSSGQFLRSALELIEEINSRGRWPLVVGGSPFYLRTLLYGLPDIPPVSRSLRGGFSQLTNEQLSLSLQQVDPVSAARLHPNDRQRLIRALEVYEGCGQPLSSFSPAKTLRSNSRWVALALDWPRAELYRRIEERLELMFAAGLVDEIQMLRQLGYHANMPAMKGIGYREFFQADRETSLSTIRSLIARNSRHLAKRQLTFYRHQFPRLQWLEPEQQLQKTRQILQQFFAAQ